MNSTDGNSAEKGPIHLMHVFPTFQVGDVQMRFCDLAAAWGDRFRHTVIAMDGDYAARDGVPAAIDVTYPLQGVLKGTVLQKARWSRQLVSQMMPDSLVTYHSSTLEWALGNTPQKVRQVHVEDDFVSERTWRQRASRVVARRIGLRGKILAVPSGTLWQLATQVWKLTAERVHHIPNGIEATHYDRDADPVLVASFGDPAKGPLIGSVGPLVEYKRIDRLIDAFANMIDQGHPGRLAIVGSGPERHSLELHAAAREVRGLTTFVDELDDPVKVLKAFDVLALSSDTEQMPAIVLQGMAAGLPVVSTSVGDVYDMVSEENRHFITGYSDRELGASLQILLASGAGPRLGAANRERVIAEYGRQAMAERWAGLLTS